MLVHSYRVELKKLQAKKISLELDLLKNPSNTRALSFLKEIEQEIEWFQTKIREGKDPGVRIN
jgi:hypothetical protein